MFRRGSYGLSDSRKGEYEAQYMGWKPCPTMVYDDSVRPLVEMTQAECPANGSGKNIMHINLSRKDLKIVQYVTRIAPRGGSKTEKYRFPPIPANDITHARVCPPGDVVATIILGYSTSSQKYLHVHVFRFPSRENAAAFEAHVMDIVRVPTNQRRIEEIRNELIDEGHLAPSVAPTLPVPSHVRSQSMDLGKTEAMNSLAEELRQKLRPNPGGAGPSAPLLLPPRDYDTISRSHGDAIRHRQAILAEKEAWDKNKPEEVERVPSLPDQDDFSGSGTESPVSTGRGTPANRPGLINRHSFGGGDLPASSKQGRRQYLPFRAGDSMPSSTLQAHKQN